MFVRFYAVKQWPNLRDLLLPTRPCGLVAYVWGLNNMIASKSPASLFTSRRSHNLQFIIIISSSSSSIYYYYYYYYYHHHHYHDSILFFFDRRIYIGLFFTYLIFETEKVTALTICVVRIVPLLRRTVAPSETWWIKKTMRNRTFYFPIRVNRI